MTNPDSSNCPQCGNPIPENAPSGLCPSCVLANAATIAKQTNPNQKSPPPSLEALTVHFSELEILEVIGVGGMGAVYKARQPKLDRFVALKILHVQDDDPAFEERFNREARVLARLNHPNIVNVYDFGTSGPYHFLIMEFIDGVNLRQAMQAGRFSSEEALTLVQEMCAALKSAHEDGILHRDIKPENILLDSNGSLKIADFGIAKLVGPDEPHNFTLTRQDALLGSPHYMAPEQFESPEDVDQRADIYSLGVVFYELLTGELPLGRFAPPSAKNDIDSRIDDIVLRTLEKERDARFQSADEVSTSVDTLSQSPPPKPTSPSNEDHGVARFATLSSIFTGISLPLVMIAMMLFLSQSVEVSEQTDHVEKTNHVVLSVSILIAILAVITPPLGFFLGISSLSDIRQSGGLKRGLNRSTFAVVTWPLLMGTAVISNLLPGPMAMPIFLLICLLVFIALCWSIAPPIRRWARTETDSLSPIFGRLLMSIGIPALLIAVYVIWMKSPTNHGDVIDLGVFESGDAQAEILQGRLHATYRLPLGSERSLAIAAIAKDAALAGKPEIAEAACQAINPRETESNQDNLTNTTRYQCALILGRAGYTLEATEIASKITNSLKRTALIKISQGDFEDNSIPPLDN